MVKKTYAVRSEAQNWRKKTVATKKHFGYRHFKVSAEGELITAAAYQALLCQDMCFFGSLLYSWLKLGFQHEGVLSHIAISLAGTFLCAGKLCFCHHIHRPELAGLWHLGHIEGNRQCYGSPKNAALKRTVWQLQAATVRQCCSESANARLHLEKAIAIGRGIAMISQATDLACHLKPFAGLWIMK
jgi:hypothetical protein